MRISPIVSKTLKVAGPAFFLSMQASSIRTACTIVARRATGGLSVLPFASLFVNCVIWALYGLLTSDPTLLLPNGVGILTGLGCTTAFASQSSSASRDLPLYWAAALLCAAAARFFVNKDANSLGLLGCFLAILVVGSPLATIKTVIRDKSTESVPFLTSLFMWLNSISWASYGLLVAKDVMIYGPNLAGLVFSSIQLSLFFIYGFPPKKGAGVDAKAVF